MSTRLFVFLFVLFSAICLSSATDRPSNFEIGCNLCKSGVSFIDGKLENSTFFNGTLNMVQNVLCGGQLFQDFPFLHQRCTGDLHSVFSAVRDYVHFYLDHGTICKDMLQCNSTFSFETFKSEALKTAIVLLSKLGIYDQALTSRLFALAADFDEGAKGLVQIACIDIQKTRNDSLPYMVAFDKICNFYDGTGKCSLCQTATEVAISDLRLYQDKLDQLLEKGCEYILSADECRKLIDGVGAKVFDTAATAVNYGELCRRFGACSRQNLFSSHCKKLSGISNILCEIINFYKVSQNATSIQHLKTEAPVTKPEALQYCSDKLDSVGHFLEHEKVHAKSWLEDKCKLLPKGEIRQACKYLFKVRFDSLYDNVVEYIEGHLPCCFLGICPSNGTLVNVPASTSSPPPEKGNNYVTCNVCKVALTELRDQLMNPDYEIELIDQLLSEEVLGHTIASILHKHPEIRLPLRSYAHKLYVYLVERIHPKTMCEKIRACTPKKATP